MTGANVARRRRRRRRNGGSNGRGPAGGRRGRRLLAVLAPLSVLLVLAGLIGAIAAAFYGINRYNEFIATVVPPEELLAQLPRGGARIYDRNGTLLYEFFDDAGGLRRPVPLSDISPALIDATVATEDSDFWENNGLNTRGLVRAAWENVSPFGGSLFEGSGGSSITQQLAKNVYIPREERAKRSVERKLKEAAIALELTNQYSKEQILEWYLNSISYGGIYTGIEAASEGYFGKSAAELTLAESALLAGIPQRPRDYEPFNNRLVAFARQSQVLDLMVRREMITPSQADDAREEEIEFRTGHFDIDAAHFVLGRVAREIEQRFGERALYEDGLEVITTIDIELQHEAERILDGWIREFEDTSDGHNGAFFALDPLTGQILVYVGSRDYFREDIEGHNDNIISLNSPGSTLKPFTYMTAFMQGWSTGTGILDTPIKVIDAATGEFFSPRNPGTGYQGVITAEKALGNSLNIPAFKTILFAGVDNVVSVLKEAGFTTLDNPLGYGPALSLGGVDITLEDLTYGYSVFATGGVMRGQQALAAYDPGERTIDPRGAAAGDRRRRRDAVRVHRADRAPRLRLQLHLPRHLDPVQRRQPVHHLPRLRRAGAAGARLGAEDRHQRAVRGFARDRRDVGGGLHAAIGRWRVGRQLRQLADGEHRLHVDLLAHVARLHDLRARASGAPAAAVRAPTGAGGARAVLAIGPAPLRPLPAGEALRGALRRGRDPERRRGTGRAGRRLVATGPHRYAHRPARRAHDPRRLRGRGGAPGPPD